MDANQPMHDTGETRKLSKVDARQGTGKNIVRYILFASLILVIVAFAVLYLTYRV